MSKSVILIDHANSRRIDRASRMLAERGYEIEWCRPADGDVLPAPEGDHVAALVFGGAESANDDTTKPYIRSELEWVEGWLGTGKPYLGICLGAQLLARTLGARVERHPEGLFEIGYVPVEATKAANGFLDGVSHVYHWHKEGFEVPDGGELLAVGPTYPNQAFRYDGSVYGLQFHPEATTEMYGNWLDSAAHMLTEPGAHSREQQLSDAKLHDKPLEAWLGRFLDDWLKDVG